MSSFIVMLKNVANSIILVFNRFCFGLYFSLFCKKIQPHTINIVNSKVLIISPHQDDELIGCGGLIKKLAENRCKVKCIFITDGSASLHPTLTPEELAIVRKEEAIKVSKLLGADSPEFLDAKDGALESTEELGIKLSSIIHAFKPNYIFLPFFPDGLSDHVSTNKLFIDSINMGPYEIDPAVFLYEIGSPIPLSSVTHYVQAYKYLDKGEALKIYSSQTMSFKPLLLIRELESLAIKNIPRGNVELFLRLDLSNYKLLFEKYLHHYAKYSYKTIYRNATMIPNYFCGLSKKKSLYNS